MAEGGVLTLHGVVQHYDWGGHNFIPDLLGIENATRRPFAELWVGAHAKAPSMVQLGHEQVPLDELIEAQPDAILGQAANAHFGGRLPYLFKILDVHKMLSIQRILRSSRRKRVLHERTLKASSSMPAAETTRTITTSRKSAWP
jgi:mannose-6-phosphate isomerase class I